MRTTTQAMEYEKERIKPSKAKDVKRTAKHQAVKTADQLSGSVLAWLTFKRFVRFVWVNKVPLTVNAFLFENAYLFVHYSHFLK